MLTSKSQAGSSVVSDDTEQYLPPEKCRICLKDGDVPIFGQEDLSQHVAEFGSIQISCEDNFPQHLCLACHSLLQGAITFRKTAQESEEMLKSTDYLMLDDNDVWPEEEVHKNEDCSYETDDNESVIKTEYLEYSSDSEPDWKYDMKSENDSIMNYSQSDTETLANDQAESEHLDIKTETTDGSEDENEIENVVDADKDNNSRKNNIKFNTVNSEFDEQNTSTHPKKPKHQKKCAICHKLVDIKHYQVHIIEHREKYKTNHNKKYGKVDCEVCGKPINKAYLKYHMKMHGTPEEQAQRFVECTICKKSFSSHYFSEHLKRVHDKKSPLKPEKKRSPKTDQSVKKCPICDKNVKQNIFQEHLAKHGAPTKRYICDQCGKEFKYPSVFKTHMLTHGSELKYQCQFCPYRGLHQGLLKIHVRTHTKDYNYKCTECPATFITKSNLSKHLQRHNGICKFKCETCNKGFYAKRDLEKHAKTVHSDLKEHVCNICGKAFGHRDNMLCHQLRVHKREKLVDKKGAIPSYLKKQYQKN